MSTITRRRVGGNKTDGSSSDVSNNRLQETTSPSSEKAAHDEEDHDDSGAPEPKFTLMEEVLLLGLKDRQGYLSFWNDSISYVLRGCIVMELAFRGRIAMVKDPNRRVFDLRDRKIEVINSEPTGEVLLDEAMKMMKTSEKMGVAMWIDLMSGETWNVMKIGYQLKQVRERLAKGLVDKGVLRTEKRNFLLFDMATHPVSDSKAKEEIVKRTRSMVSPSEVEPRPSGTRTYLRSVCMVCAAYAANVLENALAVYESELRERSFGEADALMNDFSKWPFAGSGAKLGIPSGEELSYEVIASVLNVLSNMDAIL